MRMTAPTANKLRITTRCRSIEQFIATFHRYADAESIFVATVLERPQGFATGFSFTLADGTPVLRGTGIVVEAWKTVDNPFRLPGIRLGIRWLSPRSVPVFRQLGSRGSAAKLPSGSPPPPRSRTPTADRTVPSPAPATTASPVPVPLSDPGDSWSGPTRPETKRFEFLGTDTAEPPQLAPRIATLPEAPASVAPAADPVTPADAILPVNPLVNLTDSYLEGFVECTLYEETVPPPNGELVYATPVEASLPPAPSRSRWWMLDVALVAAVAGCIVLVSDGVSDGISEGVSEGNESSEPPAAAAAPPTTVPAIRSYDHAFPVVGDGPCQLLVSSTPAGSIVALDGERRGASPIAIATSCGQHHVEISEVHHQTMAAWVTLTIEQPERIEVPLARPIHTVAVTTRPSGAEIYLDGSRAGTTPTTLNILGHVPMTLEVKKAGYRPLIQHVYSTSPRAEIAIRMFKAPPRAR